MPVSNDSTSKTLIVALALCIVCSVIVSTAAVVLKPVQEQNKALDRKRNILAAAGMLVPGQSIDEQFSHIEARVVDLRTGKFTDEVSADSYNQLKAAKDPKRSTALSPEEDPAKIFRREDYSVVYVAKDASGAVDKIILPIRGYGLWGTLYGFIALNGDANTVAGIGFYEHKETPGLGGEVDNPRWKSLWHGKEVYTGNDVAIQVIKGTVDPSAPNAEHRVDGLAGATLTTRGVNQLVRYWLGENGFEPFLHNLKSGEA
ncbi:Na(+)-translocating NADH-quinone reductase subunit C [Haliea sp. E17]|uniref:Na(+)-translocating NADH-quinone reductase subunit C n=1 Tax=Haliea sp. E17 TaxID=3401576 RepID=UPI003AB1074A